MKIKKLLFVRVTSVSFRFFLCYPAYYVHVAGATGHVIMDEQGDRDPDYWLWFFGPGKDSMTAWMEVSTSKPLNQVRQIVLYPPLISFAFHTSTKIKKMFHMYGYYNGVFQKTCNNLHCGRIIMISVLGLCDMSILQSLSKVTCILLIDTYT